MSDQTIEVTINGETRRLTAPVDVASLLESLQIDRRSVAVERNRELVPKPAFAETFLADGDLLEIVSFVGGG